MRTTIDLPEDLMRRAEATAARRGLPLEDLLTSLVEQGLSSPPAAQKPTRKPAPARGHRRALPELVPRTGAPIPSLTSAEVEDILPRDDLDRLGRTSGFGGDGPA